MWKLGTYFICYLIFMRGIKFNVVLKQGRMAIFYKLNKVRFSHKIPSPKV